MIHRHILSERVAEDDSSLPTLGSLARVAYKLAQECPEPDRAIVSFVAEQQDPPGGVGRVTVEIQSGARLVVEWEVYPDETTNGA